jgi:hypothetical protein
MALHRARSIWPAISALVRQWYANCKRKWLTIDKESCMTRLAPLVTLGCTVLVSCSGAIDHHDPFDTHRSQASHPSHLVHVGYFKSNSATSMATVADQSTVVLLEKWVHAGGEQYLARARQHGLRVFLSLDGVFFDGLRFLDAASYRQRWTHYLPLIRKYRDIIEAFIVVDEPEWRSFPGKPSDALEEVAALVRGEFPGAQMAVNYWHTTVSAMAVHRSTFDRYYPKSFNIVAVARYREVFDARVNQQLLDLTAGLAARPKMYLIPKVFTSSKFPGDNSGRELVSDHLEPALQFARAHSRVFAIIGFTFESLGEDGHTLHGAVEYPEVQSWFRQRKAAIAGRPSNPNPDPNPGPNPTPNPSPGCSDHMSPGETLQPGQSRCSANGRVKLVFQGDGNLVLYEGSRALWNTGTTNRGAHLAAMQTDGNLVVYRPGQALWDSGTWGHPGARLVVQNDGNVVVYDPSNRPLWATGTQLSSPTPTDPGDSAPPRPSSGKTPIGWLDSVAGGTVSGWACDPDQPDRSIDVHIYVGGPAGSGAPAYAVRAAMHNEPAVSSACGGGSRHRFRLQLPGHLVRAGTQIHAYGIDVTGDAVFHRARDLVRGSRHATVRVLANVALSGSAKTL